jgi:phosphoribosyl 1,2-cyclic phosphodiesterase
MEPESEVRPELLVRVHGCSPPVMRVYTRDTARERYARATGLRLANTACSVIVRDQVTGRLLLHLLVDAGLGVMEALVHSAATLGVGDERLDALLVTHAHYDHIAELPQVAENLRVAARFRGDQAYRLPVYCTEPVAARAFGAGGTFPYIANDPRFASLVHQPVVPCEPVVFPLPGLAGATLSVTPVSVWHGPSAPGAVIYVVQALGKKVILAWDLLQVVEAPDAPTDAQQAAFVSALPRRSAELVHDADVLLLDATSWHPAPSYGHISILEGLALARRWRAQRTYWIHHSIPSAPGREAPLNPVVALPDIEVRRELTEAELHWLAGRVSATLALDIRVAYAGLTLGLIDAWPEVHPHPARFA